MYITRSSRRHYWKYPLRLALKSTQNSLNISSLSFLNSSHLRSRTHRKCHSQESHIGSLHHILNGNEVINSNHRVEWVENRIRWEERLPVSCLFLSYSESIVEWFEWKRYDAYKVIFGRGDSVPHLKHHLSLLELNEGVSGDEHSTLGLMFEVRLVLVVLDFSHHVVSTLVGFVLHEEVASLSS